VENDTTPSIAWTACFRAPALVKDEAAGLAAARPPKAVLDGGWGSKNHSIMRSTAQTDRK
jgi:hypothetical protein